MYSPLSIKPLRAKRLNYFQFFSNFEKYLFQSVVVKSFCWHPIGTYGSGRSRCRPWSKEKRNGVKHNNFSHRIHQCAVKIQGRSLVTHFNSHFKSSRFNHNCDLKNKHSIDMGSIQDVKKMQGISDLRYLKLLYCKGNIHIQTYTHNWVTWKWAPWEFYFLERSCKFIKTNTFVKSASNRKHFKAQQTEKTQLATPSTFQNTQRSCRITLMLVCSWIRLLLPIQ